jgi:hypothetical protein
MHKTFVPNKLPGIEIAEDNMLATNSTVHT